MKPKIDRASIAQNLRRLAAESPAERVPVGARVVDEHRSLIRQAIRKGHRLSALAQAINMKPRTLQKYLSKAGLFFRKPRKNKGVVIKPYKKREKKPTAALDANP